MKLYVAAKSTPDQLQRADAFMRAAEAAGHRITHDWTKEIVANIVKPYSPAQLIEAATKDIEAVLELEHVGSGVDALPRGGAFILLWHPELNGALTELGVALPLEHVTVVVVGLPQPIAPRANIFLRLADLYFDTDEAALAWLQEKRR